MDLRASQPPMSRQRAHECTILAKGLSMNQRSAAHFITCRPAVSFQALVVVDPSISSQPARQSRQSAAGPDENFPQFFFGCYMVAENDLGWVLLQRQ